MTDHWPVKVHLCDASVQMKPSPAQESFGSSFEVTSTKITAPRGEPERREDGPDAVQVGQRCLRDQDFLPSADVATIAERRLKICHFDDGYLESKMR